IAEIGLVRLGTTETVTLLIATVARGRPETENTGTDVFIRASAKSATRLHGSGLVTIQLSHGTCLCRSGTVPSTVRFHACLLPKLTLG
ncbi:unnamed protein product, partial [Arabidopsis halleri]